MRRAAAAAVLAVLVLSGCQLVQIGQGGNSGNPLPAPTRLACPKAPSSCHPFEVTR